MRQSSKAGEGGERNSKARGAGPEGRVMAQQAQFVVGRSGKRKNTQNKEEGRSGLQLSAFDEVRRGVFIRWA